MTIFFRKMSGMGLKSEYFAQNPPLEQVAKDLLGRKIRVKVGTREWQNVKRNSVLAILPFSGASAPGQNMPPAPTFAPPTLPTTPSAPVVAPPQAPSPPVVPVPAPPVAPNPPAASVPVPEPENDVPAPPVITPAPSLPF
jgi:hypothetical protein